MFEISITWWKAKGDPDPDQTPEWTSVIPGTHAATPRNTVARLQKLFKCAEGYSRSCRWGPSTRGAFSSGKVYLPGNIEKGTPAQSDFAPANRPFPSAHGDLVPAMRARYVANDDFNFRYGGWSEARVDEAILKRFGKPSWVSDEYYVPAEEFLARRLIGASVPCATRAMSGSAFRVSLEKRSRSSNTSRGSSYGRRGPRSRNPSSTRSSRKSSANIFPHGI